MLDSQSDSQSDSMPDVPTTDSPASLSPASLRTRVPSGTKKTLNTRAKELSLAVKEKTKEVGNKVKEKTKAVKEKTKEVGANLKQKTKEVSAKVKQKTSQVKQKTREETQKTMHRSKSRPVGSYRLFLFLSICLAIACVRYSLSGLGDDYDWSIFDNIATPDPYIPNPAWLLNSNNRHYYVGLSLLTSLLWYISFVSSPSFHTIRWMCEFVFLSFFAGRR